MGVGRPQRWPLGRLTLRRYQVPMIQLKLEIDWSRHLPQILDCLRPSCVEHRMAVGALVEFVAVPIILGQNRCRAEQLLLMRLMCWQPLGFGRQPRLRQVLQNESHFQLNVHSSWWAYHLTCLRRRLALSAGSKPFDLVPSQRLQAFFCWAEISGQN